MSKFTIPTVFKAVDNLSAPLQRMSANMDKFDKSAQGVFGHMNEITKQVFSFASAVALSTAAVGGIAFSIKSIMDYEDAIANLSAITGTSGSALNTFKKQIEEVAYATNKSSIDVANAFTMVGNNVPALLKDAKALGEVTKQSIILAKASKMELAPSAGYLTTIMNQFNAPASKAAEVIDLLAGGMVIGSTDINKVSEAMLIFGGAAGNAGIKLNESVTAIEAISDKVTDMGRLGTQFRNIFDRMSRASTLDKPAVDALRQAGVNTAILESKTTPLIDKLKELSKLKDNDKQKGLLAAFANPENLQSLMPLLDAIPKYEGMLKSLNGEVAKGGIAQEMANKNNATLSARIEALKNKYVTWITTSNEADMSLKILGGSVDFVTKNLTTILSLIGLVTGAFLLYKGAMLAVNGVMMLNEAFLTGKFIVAMIKQIALTNSTTFATAALAVAQSSLNAAWLANPIGVIVVGMLTLGAAIYGVSKAYTKLTTEQKAAKELSDRTNQKTIEQRAEATALFAALRQAAQGSKAYNDTLAKLEQLQPGIIDKYGLQVKAIDKINAAENELIKTIMKRAEAEAAAEIVREKATNLLRAKEELANPGFLASIPMIGGGIMANKFANVNQAQNELEAAASQQQALNTEAETKGTFTGNIDLTVRDPNNRVETSASNGINIQKPVTTSTIGQ